MAESYPPPSLLYLSGSMRLLEVPYFKQDTEYTCGPTVLQMVLAYFGVRESESGLAKQLKTDSNRGTEIHRMMEVARGHGFHVYLNNDASLDEITHIVTSFKAPCIIRYLETDENVDHYAVALAASPDEVVLHDPWHGPFTRLSRREFEKRWTCDALGTCSKWLMAVTPEPLPLGRQYNPIS